jgi:asparagine synthase (glutamine-hydrolysing)
MCSIFGILACRPVTIFPCAATRWNCRNASATVAGLERVYLDEGALLVHERLAIVDPAGSQPLLSADGQLALAVNGEIYNHQALRR